MIFGIWLAVLGILGAANLIIAKRPDAKEYIDKIAPYQGWIGAVSAIWGLWGVISCILNLNILQHWPIWWVTWLATSLVLLSLGLLLGVGIFKSFIKDPTANAKMDQTVAKLAPYQGKLGLAAIALGVWAIAVRVVWF